MKIRSRLFSFNRFLVITSYMYKVLKLFDWFAKVIFACNAYYLSRSTYKINIIDL